MSDRQTGQLEWSGADVYNRQFAHDVLWGSPFGAIVAAYDEIHDPFDDVCRRQCPTGPRRGGRLAL
jgi:hypothetical protein